MLRVFNCLKEISEPNARVFAWGAVSPFVPNNKLKYWAEQCDTVDYQRPTTTGERLSERKKKNHHRGYRGQIANNGYRVPGYRFTLLALTQEFADEYVSPFPRQPFLLAIYRFLRDLGI